MTTKSLLQTMQDFLVPRFGMLEGKLDALQSTVQTEIRRLDQRMDSMEHEMRSSFTQLDKRLDTAIDLHERIAALEAKIGRN